MLFTLEALKAKEGDCLLLHWGSVDRPNLAVIDGGPGNVYSEFLEPRLKEIMGARGQSSLGIDLVMVSHVDADHIVGVRKLFAGLKTSAENNDPSPFVVDRLWHNTFDDIIGNRLNAHYQQFTASFAASASGELRPETVDALGMAVKERDDTIDDDEAVHLGEDIALILAGHADARTLRDSHKFLFQKGLVQGLNKPFQQTLITAELTPDPLAFKGIDIKIIGPMQPEIDALQEDFDKYLKEKNIATPEAALAAYADKSVPNLSSIVCLVTMGSATARKSILLTGDARGDKMIAGLQQAGLLGTGPKARMHVSIFKVPHHGSSRNATPEFFKAITGDHYIFSGDGKHGNPDREAVEWVIQSRKKSERYTLIFTYKLTVVDARRKKEAEKHGHVWDTATDGILELLDEYRSKGHKFKVKEDAPLKIDLGDEKVEF